jgi:hypothetical protein
MRVFLRLAATSLVLALAACSGSSPEVIDETPRVSSTSPAPSPPVAVPASSPTPATPPPHEVKVDRCEKVGLEVASGTIKNLGSEPTPFAIQVEFYDKGGAKIEQGIDFVSSLGPGQTARWQQDNFTESEYTLGDCKVVSLS